MGRASVNSDMNRAIVQHSAVDEMMMRHFARLRAIDSDALGGKGSRNGEGSDDRLQEGLRKGEESALLGAVFLGALRTGVELHGHPLAAEE